MARKLKKQKEPKKPPKLETYVRRVLQPPKGYIPLETLSTKGYGGEKIAMNTKTSPMLISSAIQIITAIGACGEGDDYKHRRLSILDKSYNKIMDRVNNLSEEEKATEIPYVEKSYSTLINHYNIDGEFIQALTEMLTYAPLSAGGARHYPDGKEIEITADDKKLIWQLARRAYSFVYREVQELGKLEFKVPYTTNAKYFSYTTIDFLSNDTVYKIAPLTTLPQERDLLLLYLWAVIADVDRFCLYNPVWDRMYEGKVSEVDPKTRKEIDACVLTV